MESTSNISTKDVIAFKEYMKGLINAYWETAKYKYFTCSECNKQIKPKTGFCQIPYTVMSFVCDDCGDKLYGENLLEELRRNPNYFGESELKNARDFTNMSQKEKQNYIENLRDKLLDKYNKTLELRKQMFSDNQKDRESFKENVVDYALGSLGPSKKKKWWKFWK